MTFPYKLIDLTYILDGAISTWNSGCGFNHDLHIDYSDCKGEDKLDLLHNLFWLVILLSNLVFVPKQTRVRCGTRLRFF